MEFDAGQPDSDQSGEDFHMLWRKQPRETGSCCLATGSRIQDPPPATDAPDVRLIKDMVKGCSVTGRDMSNQSLRKCAGFVSGFTGMYISSYEDESPDMQEICSFSC